MATKSKRKAKQRAKRQEKRAERKHAQHVQTPVKHRFLKLLSAERYKRQQGYAPDYFLDEEQ